MPRRVLAIGLDGFEITVAERMMGEGQLPALARLLARGRRFRLDHGAARDTGLAWEHFATGAAPADYGRFSAVTFDPARYRVVQSATRTPGFARDLGCRVVAFDLPYHELDAAHVEGIANWGAHDPGVAAHSNPPGLRAEADARFGAYPAKAFIYAHVWPSEERTRTMGEALVAAARKRTELALWLLGERLSDWNLGIVVTSEMHSGLEALWHGIDDTHPLHDLPSAAPAGEAIRALYVETDRMIDALAARFADATLVVFAMHGMGPNRADLPSMVLLPELLYRRAFGRRYLHPRSEWRRSAGRDLGPYRQWSNAILSNMGSMPQQGRLPRIGQRLGLWPRPVSAGTAAVGAHGADLPLAWMPAARYAPFWPRMDSFALPAFYNGQIRVNLAGRESRGRVEPKNYAATLDALDADLSRLTDGPGGDRAVAALVRPVADAPLAAGPTQCDLAIAWATEKASLWHPELGEIGPVPYRRTGGHTGGYGFAIIAGEGIAPGSGGVRSSFDVAPTLVDLLGESTHTVSGKSLL